MEFIHSLKMKKHIFYAVFIILFQNICAGANKCCTPDQWESFLFIDYGNVFIDQTESTPRTAYSIINGTVKLSYDYINQRMYVFVNGTEYSPLIPQPVPDAQLMLYDYKEGIEYEVTGGRECDKSKLDTNMTRYCVPDSAMEVTKGTFGTAGLHAVNYEFNQTTPLELKVAAAMTPDSCIPLQAVYYSDNGPSGIMCSLQAVDVTSGIKDTSVFNVPEPCKFTDFKNTKKQVNSKARIARRLVSFLV